MAKIVERVYVDDPELKQQTIRHHINRYEFAKTVRKVNPNDLAIDLACGSGYGTEILRHAGYKTLGLDIDREAIKYAKNSYPWNQYVVSDIVEYNYNSIIDLAVMFEAIEHITYTEGLLVIEKIRQKMNSESKFVVSVPRDINSKYNHFHKSQWDYTVLKNILGSVFGSVEILGQDWDTGEISDRDVINNDFYIAICKL